MRSRLAALIVTVAIAAPAAASRFHFEVVRSTPADGATLEAAPKRLQVWFSQLPARGVSRLALKRGDADVPLTETTIDAESKSMYADPKTALAPGAYALMWRGAGDDGHVQTGTIAFTIAAD
ncbi:MAG TPA: copper resistance protein CopC [Vicinamibacterales bacterium]|nr:copper resistance protein CopC [Vicinamibacterales bacterium]